MKRVTFAVLVVVLLLMAFSGAASANVMKSRHETAKNSIGNIR